MNQCCAQEIRMAAEAAEAELRAKGDLTVAELKSQLAGRYGEIEMKDRAYARVFTHWREAREELKKKKEQLTAQESELSALRAKVAELMTQQAARDGVNLASVDNSLYPSSTMRRLENTKK